MKDCPKAKKEVGGIEILVPMVEIDVGCGGVEFLCCQECNEPTVRITHCAGCGHFCENCDHCGAMEQCCNDFIRAIDLGQKPKSFRIGEERTNEKLKAENQIKIKEEEVDDHERPSSFLQMAARRHTAPGVLNLARARRQGGLMPTELESVVARNSLADRANSNSCWDPDEVWNTAVHLEVLDGLPPARPFQGCRVGSVWLEDLSTVAEASNEETSDVSKRCQGDDVSTIMTESTKYACSDVSVMEANHSQHVRPCRNW